jgi:hypothetical protein
VTGLTIRDVCISSRQQRLVKKEGHLAAVSDWNVMQIWDSAAQTLIGCDKHHRPAQ